MSKNKKPIPLDFSEMLAFAFRSFKQQWKPIVFLSIGIWIVYASLFAMWFIATFNIEFLQKTLLDSTNEAIEGTLSDYIYTATNNLVLLFGGIFFFIFFYIVLVSFLSLVSIELFANVENPISSKNILGEVIKNALKRTPKMMLVYIVFWGILLLLLTFFVGIASYVGIIISSHIDPTFIIIYFVVVVPFAFLISIIVWLVIYSRLVFSGQATAFKPLKSNPFRVSSQITRGRNFNILARVLVFSIIIGGTASIASTGFLFFDLGPVFLFFVGILGRIFVSIFSSTLIVASLTPLYMALEEK
jgi:hypothetical protein